MAEARRRLAKMNADKAEEKRAAEKAARVAAGIVIKKESESAEEKADGDQRKGVFVKGERIGHIVISRTEGYRDIVPGSNRQWRYYGAQKHFRLFDVAGNEVRWIFGTPSNQKQAAEELIGRLAKINDGAYPHLS